MLEGNEIKKLGAIRPLPHEYNTLRLDYIDKIDVKNPKVIHHTGKKGNEVIKEQIIYEYKVKVLRVVDGDTVDVDIDLGFSTWLKKQRIRLYGIDTPESRTRDLEEKKYGKMR